MTKAYTIRFTEDDDGEEIEVLRPDGSSLVSVGTSYDCPEDNSASRLGLTDFAKAIIEDLGGTARVTR